MVLKKRVKTMNNIFKTEILNYSYIILGCFIMAFGIIAFLSPNQIATGGTAGLAIVFHSITNLSIGTLMILINLPLIGISVKFLGKTFALKTIICILSLAFFTFLLDYLKLKALSNELLLSTLYGGISVGIGLGFIFKGGASAGGGTILAKIISQKFKVKTSNVVLALDTVVVVLVAITFNSIELALWSLISIFATSKLIDTILTGASSQKIVHISSSKNLSILSKLISDQLGIKGTIVKGSELGETENKDIIFILVEKNKLSTLKQIALQFDHSVRMIVMEASEVSS